MKYALSTLFVLLFALGLRAQEDTVRVDILPYYEPLHSDRPGATFDASTVKQSMVLQLGTNVDMGGLFPNRDYADFTAYGTSAMLRIPTCIGEFDAGVGSSRAIENYLVYSPTYINQSTRTYTNFGMTGMYRNEIFTTEKFTLGGILGFNYEVRNLDYKGFRNPRPDTFDLRFTQWDYTGHNVRALAYLNAQYNFNSHWSIASTIGGYGDVYGGDNFLLLGTLNLGYSIQKWSFFGEVIYNYSESIFHPIFLQAGLTHSVSRDFQLDMFVSTYDVSGSLIPPTAEVRSINFGFTYNLR